MIYTNSRIANFLATERPDSAAWVLATQIVEFGPVPDYGGPPPIASSTPGYEVRDLDEAALPLPTEQELEAWEEPAPPDPNPVTDVEIATGNFKRAREAAPEALDRLKGTVWAALVAGGMGPDEATAAGVGLVLLHGPLLAAFEAAGGHPVAAAALYQAIASKPSAKALPWLSKGILEVFAGFLVPK